MLTKEDKGDDTTVYFTEREELFEHLNTGNKMECVYFSYKGE